LGYSTVPGFKLPDYKLPIFNLLFMSQESVCLGSSARSTQHGSML